MTGAPAAAAAWSDADTPAACLVVFGVDRWGVGCLAWQPATWAAEARDAAGAAPHPRTLDRVGAALTLLTRPDEYYATAPGFTDVVLGLAADWYDPTSWRPPAVGECAWGVLEAHLIDPPGPDDRFTPEVNRYVELIGRREGFAVLPPVFRAFGFRPDPDLPPAADYAADPVLAQAAAAGAAEAVADLNRFLADRLADLAARLARLALTRTDPTPVVRFLADQARRLAGAADTPGDLP